MSPVPSNRNYGQQRFVMLFPSIKRRLTLGWHPAKHVRDRGHVPFAAPCRLDAMAQELAAAANGVQPTLALVGGSDVKAIEAPK
jgi:hypothetical protein